MVFWRFSVQDCVYPRMSYIHRKTLKEQNFRIYKIANSMGTVLLFTALRVLHVYGRSAKFTICIGPSLVRYLLTAQ